MSMTEGAEPSGALAAARPRAQQDERATPGMPTLLLVGNPNVGKTSLFNRLARRNERVGNYPGVTVERRSAEMPLPSGRRVLVSDVPGAYSLSARSREEQIALQAILGWAGNPRPDLVVVVVDAGQLVRNLYLALQIIELRVPVAIALNMVDEAGDRAPSAAALEDLLGVRVVATNARTGSGISELAAAVEAELGAPRQPRVHVTYPAALKRDVDRVADALPVEWRADVERERALGLWALSSLEADDELTDISPALRERCAEVLKAAGDRDVDREIIESRYQYLEAKLAEASARGEARPGGGPSRTERIDRVLLHPAYGFVCFIGIMLVVFQSLFAWADPAVSLVEWGFAAVHSALETHLPEGFVRDLLTMGVIDGVGNVVVFLPQILLLFLFIGLLEDSGYMARVAYLIRFGIGTLPTACATVAVPAKATTPTRTFSGCSATNCLAAFCAATRRLGSTSVARMLPEMSMARITVSCCVGRVTVACGRASASSMAPSARKNSAGGTWRRIRCPAPIASRTMVRLA